MSRLDLTQLTDAAVCILWDDAHQQPFEGERDDIIHRPWKYVSVGILIADTAEGVTIATDIGEDGKVRGTNFVPRAMIVDQWVVGKLRKPRRRKAHVPDREQSAPEPVKS